MTSNFVPEPVHTHNYLHLVGVVILYYDFLLTFGQEYWSIWKNRRTVASSLFFLNRYLPIFADIAVNVGNFYEFPTEAGCRHYSFFRQVLLIFNQVVVCYILFLRTFALYGRDWRVGGAILGFAAILFGVSVWAVVGQREGVELRGGCHTAADRITAIRIAVAWESLFLFDCTIFSLTLFKTLRERRRNPVTSGRRDIVSLVMRDGALYFAVMASANLANTITFYGARRLVTATFGQWPIWPGGRTNLSACEGAGRTDPMAPMSDLLVKKLYMSSTTDLSGTQLNSCLCLLRRSTMLGYFPSLANLATCQICNSVSFSNFENRLDRFVPLLKRSRLVKKHRTFRQIWGRSYPCTKVAVTRRLAPYVLEPLLRGCLSTAASSISITMMSRLMLNLHASAHGRSELATTRVPGAGSSTESTDNSTSLLFTSRISMPHALESAWDPEASRLNRESVYVRDLHAGDGRGRDGGYIEEVYELADYRGGADSDQGAFLRVPVPTHGGVVGEGGVEIAKPIVGGRVWYD